MDFAVLSDSLPLYAQAALLTVRVAFFGIIAALVIGVVCAGVQSFRVPLARHLAAAYIQLSRNTPLIVQLFFLYFGLPKLGVRIDSEQCAIIGLAFLGGGYMAEAIRSGLESVDQIQWQSAASLGLTRLEALRHVVLPQALAISMPALTANVIFLIKETSVVSVVALPDLVYIVKEQIGTTYNTAEALTLLVAFYLIILLPVSLLAGVLERSMRHATFGT